MASDQATYRKFWDTTVEPNPDGDKPYIARWKESELYGDATECSVELALGDWVELYSMPFAKPIRLEAPNE